MVLRTVAIPKPAHSAAEVYDLLVKAMTPKTRVPMVSHMITGGGAILPVKELCAEAARGIFTVLDGAAGEPAGQAVLADRRGISIAHRRQVEMTLIRAP